MSNNAVVKPVCPYCKKEMKVIRYNVYYDEIVYWGCECQKRDLEKYVEVEWHCRYD